MITGPTLTDFRSYESARLEPGAGVTVLHGPNGAGKTNVLEALSFLTPGKVTLTVRNMEAGQATEEVEIDYNEDAFEIGFNARYLMDIAGQITGDEAQYRFADPASPTLVLDPADPGVQYVLMPLRV